ncbi:MAG TPA: SPOR domain-containing protein [Steroidobacteraceae bacterium]|jgi:DedD protein|nr:SPOR domain-containing protein [Steroidobacteraceae bacterium]
MENRLKERLTGAAILVALIVLLVPEMFHGQRGDVAATASSGEGPPVRSYTIDLSNGPARTAPLQSTPPAPAATAVPDNGTDSAPPPTAPATSPSAPSSGAASRAPPPTAAVAAASSPRTGTGSWSVQLGIFAQHDNAERLMHSALAKGFAASVSERDLKGLYHVQVGNLNDHAAAQAMRGRLHDQGFPAALVPPSSAAARTQQH